MNVQKPLCVLGVMTTEKGLLIKDDMLKWLQPIYDVTIVEHEGSQFELPALLRAQELASDTNRPVLYLHTRGAVNEYPTTKRTHEMWRREFGDQFLKYQALVNLTHTPLVVAPYIDISYCHRYNGFIANPAAWRIAPLKPTQERHDYESIWKGVPGVQHIGTLMQYECNMINHIRTHLLNNF